ncbi:MAG: hypothetical protein AB1896_22045 [Thermodesulfobacteriota bacterium]
MNTDRLKTYYPELEKSPAEDRTGLGLSVAELLREYVRADETGRLYLWLDHRELRPEFDAVAEMASRAGTGWSWLFFKKK